MVSTPYSHVVNQRKMAASGADLTFATHLPRRDANVRIGPLARLPFGGAAATSTATNFRKFWGFQAMARQFVYFMQGLTKSYPTRKVLDNINLSFYPDAKIGVLGVNGSGKSTLLRIMAGIDTEYNGDGWVAEGARVGYLPQEPQLDADRSVRENVMEGVAAQKAILERYNELATNYSDETAD